MFVASQSPTNPYLERHVCRRHSRQVLLFFLCLFLFTCSGRLGNWDPKAQLQAATALVSTGRLSVAEHPTPQSLDLWIQNAEGRYYQAHDLGGVLFMTPAAGVGVALTWQQPVEARILEPPWAARALVALQYAALAAVGCWAMYQFFAGIYPLKAAFWLSLAFAATTTYWSYARIAYDVLGACVGVCLLLRACGDSLRRPEGDTRDVFWIALAFMLACIFRFSLTPFLLVGLMCVVYLLRHKWGWARVALCGTLIVGGTLPSLAYNYVRTAAPLKNGATGHHPATAALQGTLWDGLYGLLLSPNWGIVWFAPIFLLLLILPFAWRQLPITTRQLFVCFSMAAVSYIATVAKLTNWTGHSGWGPRYLMPFLPVFFLAAAAVLVQGWPKHKRLLGALIAFSVILNVPPLLTNFRLAADAYPGGREMFAPWPRQQAAAWQALGLGLRGEPLPAPDEIMADPIRSRGRNFPDLWTVRLMELSPVGAFAGAVITLALLFGVLWYGRALTRLHGLVPPSAESDTAVQTIRTENLSSLP